MSDNAGNKPSPWAALERRKLAQWLLAYAAGAWVLLQVLGMLSAAYHWPDAVMRISIGAAIVGLGLTLVLAWFHGERGTQKVGTLEFAILALLLAVGGGVLWRVERGASDQGASSPAAAPDRKAAASAPGATAAGARSIAVLPFENLSDDKANAYFASGIQDLILTKLSEIAELTVSSRTSTEKFRSHPEDLHAVGQQLGVASILEGSVQKAGNQVLINVQLIDAATDKHLWAQSYTRTLDNIFGVEGEVAQTIADALKAKLSAEEAETVAKPPTTNKQAYDVFLRSIYMLKSFNRTLNRAELEKSAELAKQATGIDPNFTDAYNWQALAYSKLGDRPAEQEAAVRRALALEPNDSNAHRQLAYLLSRKGEHKAAIAEAEEARRLAPGKSTSFLAMANTLGKAGRIDEAAETMRELVKLHPNENFYRAWLAMLEQQRHRYAEARDVLQPAVVRDPADIAAAALLAETYVLGFGDLAAARATLKSVLTPVAASAPLAASWYRVEMLSRDPAAAQALVATTPADGFADPLPPRDLLEADAFRTSGNTEQARSHYAAALAALRQTIATHPDAANAQGQLALALLGLGRNEEAIGASRRAVELESVTFSAEFGPGHLANLAQVYAQTGHGKEAVELLRKLLDMPAGNVVSVPLLKLDPAWDPIRNDPSFEALLKRG